MQSTLDDVVTTDAVARAHRGRRETQCIHGCEYTTDAELRERIAAGEKHSAYMAVNIATMRSILARLAAVPDTVFIVQGHEGDDEDGSMIFGAFANRDAADAAIAAIKAHDAACPEYPRVHVHHMVTRDGVVRECSASEQALLDAYEVARKAWLPASPTRDALGGPVIYFRRELSVIALPLQATCAAVITSTATEG